MLDENIVISGNRALARSYAKINLTLDVLGKLPNGYHEVCMIMQTVNLFDLVIVDKLPQGIHVSTNLKYLPNNDKNIAYKAAAAFFKQSGKSGGVKIRLHKNIPVSAGLAGGSGNAAAVLCAMNMLFDLPLTTEELLKIGATLGADVPYCILGGTQLAEGIGDKLSALPPMPHMYVVLVKPPINVSTALIYEQIDSTPIHKHPNTASFIDALESNNIPKICSGLCNVMETVTKCMHPIICGIKQKMITDGAIGSLMSGSGPTVFGLFTDYLSAKQCADSFSIQFQDVYVTNIQP